MKNDIAIQLSGVSKHYTIHHEKPTLVERLTRGKDEEFWALKNINLTIRKGERIGIIASMSYPFQKRIIEKLSRYDYTHCI